jgi:DNA-binding LytR/AlgR family response regulator
MNKKLYELLSILREDMGLLLSICFGVFLFILFFQPFPLSRFDFNNRLLFVAGMAGIIFLFMFLFRIVFPWLIRNFGPDNYESDFPVYMDSFVMLSLSSVAFAFYLRYVGLVPISFYIMFRVVSICLAVPVILKLYDTLKELKQQNESLIQEKKSVQRQLEKYEEGYLNKSIRFYSENNTEDLSLPVADVALIKSADNYVEIVYKEGEIYKKKLIRNTLKNIEKLTGPYSNLIRCHRICIINTHFVEKLNKNYNNHWLSIKGYNEQIPVSRQYLLKLKEIL